MPLAPFLAEARSQLEHTLDSLLKDTSSPLIQSARYSTLSGGKRLRPLLMLATLADYKIPLAEGLVPACALELLHTYSLIHDDLPCMDDDDLRRGKPTLHKIVPEWQALLTGDYLLTYAFDLLANAPHLDTACKLDLIRLLSQEAGAEGLIGGQTLDLLSTDTPIDAMHLEEMHAKKTASLVVVSLVGGGIIAKAPKKDKTLLRHIGKDIGVAYQLVDDLLDASSTTEELGKPIGSDASKNKSTALSILGEERAQQRIQQLFDSAQTLCKQLSIPVPLLSALLQQMIQRRH